ncbi:MAG TPA: hypothetical protein VKB35_17815 [Ktedonobacteraceae bacterium]|nr:hypothetical protein [Ktedonobacteraceae bacterium]
MADFDELLPEEADERDQRLMHDLRRIYRTDTQTVEHLARIRQRYTPPTILQVQSSTRNAEHPRFPVAGERS